MSVLDTRAIFPARKLKPAIRIARINRRSDKNNSDDGFERKSEPEERREVAGGG